jgi:DNA-binding transcriptional LysR family regulator
VQDLIGQPLFASEQSWNFEIKEWAGDKFPELNLEGSSRLSYNGSMFALEGLGVLLTFRNLVNCSEGSGLTFRPLDPQLETHLYLIWNKYQTFTPLAQKFLDQIQSSFTTLHRPLHHK